MKTSKTLVWIGNSDVATGRYVNPDNVESVHVIEAGKLTGKTAVTLVCGNYVIDDRSIGDVSEALGFKLERVEQG